MPATLDISDDVLQQIDKELAKLSIIQRSPVLKRGLRAAGAIVKKRYRDLIPPPGYAGDKPGLKPLRQTVSDKFIEYPSGRLVEVVGAAYPAGAHAHLLEEGHEKVLWGRHVGGSVRAFHYLQQAVAGTQSAQDAAILKVMREATAEARAG